MCRGSLFELLMLLYGVLKTTKCCEIYSFVDSGSAQVLEGHVVETITRPLVHFCWGDCVSLPWCFTINVRRTSEGIFECELNNSSKKANPHKMAAKEGWSYHEMTSIDSESNNRYVHKIKEDLGNGWRRYGNTEIKLFTEKKTWTNARSHCHSLGGDLVSIFSPQENDFVYHVFVKQLNLSYIRNDQPNVGMAYDTWELSQSDPTVELKGTPGNVLYKTVDGETALYFTRGKGYAEIPVVKVNPDEFTIMYWILPLNDSTGGWIHPIMLLNEHNLTNPLLNWFYQSGKPHMFLYTDHAEKGALRFEYDSWNHIAVSWNRTTRNGFFMLNGTKKYTLTGPPPSMSGVQDFYLGTRNPGYLNNNQTFWGFLKEIILINKSLTIPEVRTFSFWNEHGAWIGLNDQANTGQFTWSDRTTLGQFKPFPGYQPQPALSGRKCTVIGNHGKWFDKVCTLEYPFICEKSMPP